MAGYEASPAWQGIGIFQHHLLINHLGQQQYPQMTGHKIPFRLFPGTPVIYDFHWLPLLTHQWFQDDTAQDMDQFHPFQRQLQRRSLATKQPAQPAVV